MSNLKDQTFNIKTDFEDFLNILQERKKALNIADNIIFKLSHDNPLLKQKKYRKKRGVKGTKAQEEH